MHKAGLFKSILYGDIFQFSDDLVTVCGHRYMDIMSSL